jgi:hypothetical protein
MDPAGARALAKRIEEQRQLEAEARRERVDTTDSHAPPPDGDAGSEPAPTVLFTPVAPRPVKRAEPAPPQSSQIEIARAPAHAAPKRDVRMYSREWRREEVDGRQRVVTTIRCLALVDGEWQSRVVDIRVEDDPD